MTTETGRRVDRRPEPPRPKAFRDAELRALEDLERIGAPLSPEERRRLVEHRQAGAPAADPPKV